MDVEDGLRMLRRKPNDIATALGIGVRAMETRREKDVLPTLEAMAMSNPDNADILHIIGLLHRSAGNLAVAVGLMDRAASLGPPTARLAQARAQIALESGLPAIELFAVARALAPLDAGVILGQSAGFLAAGLGKEADSVLADVLVGHPGWIEGHDALGRLRFAAGRRDVTEAVDIALASAPQDARLWQIKIAILHRAGWRDQESEAIALASKRLGQTSMIVAARTMLAVEIDDKSTADAGFAKLDTFADTTLTTHWLRHKLRCGQPELIADAAAALTGKSDARHFWPYISLAWRLVQSPQARWMEDFDCFVRTFDLIDQLPSLNVLSHTLRSLHKTQDQPLDQSVRNGTQTDGPLFSLVDPVIQQVRAAVMEAVDTYIRDLPTTAYGHPLLGAVPSNPRIVGSWSVLLRAGGKHDAHFHTQGWLSSALYVTVPVASADRREGWLTLGEPQQTLGTGLPYRRLIEPRPGRLVLFPSTMWHATRLFFAGDRLSIAFDVD